MTPRDVSNAPAPALARRRGLLLVLLAATLAAGAAARLAISAPRPGPDPSGDRPRVFTAPAAGPVRFSGTLEGTAVLAGGDGLVRMELALAADGSPRALATRVPTDLVVVLDRSGSMSGDKIVHARTAVRALLGSLGDADRFALVSYADAAQPIVPLTPVSGAERSRWSSLVETIGASGGTNLSAGLDVALGMVDAARAPGRVARVILISDGLANQGDTSRPGLLARARRAAAGESVLSTVGVGADFDEGLLAGLADAGTGNFHFLANAVGLAEIFAAEFETARETAASGLRVAIEPGPGVAVVDAAGYPLERGPGGAVAFRPGALFAGQDRRVWVTLRVPVREPGEVRLGRFTLTCTVGGVRSELTLAGTPVVVAVADEDRFYSALDAGTWEQGVLVDRFNALRRSVAGALQAGRAQQALREIERYRAEVAAQNARVRSAPVARQLDEAAALASEVRGAVSGEAPIDALRMKQLRALGYEAGRPGSRK